MSDERSEARAEAAGGGKPWGVDKWLERLGRWVVRRKCDGAIFEASSIWPGLNGELQVQFQNYSETEYRRLGLIAAEFEGLDGSQFVEEAGELEEMPEALAACAVALAWWEEHKGDEIETYQGNVERVHAVEPAFVGQARAALAKARRSAE
jgi:hypothetical protein